MIGEDECLAPNVTPSGFHSDLSRKGESISNASDMEGIPTYKNDYPKKGICLILNMENFSVGKLKKRKGTDKDKDKLTEVFGRIGFEVRCKEDQTCEEIFKWFNKIAGEDHSQRNCFACVILSHGDERGFYGTDDVFEENKMLEIFKGDNCKSLAGKPKLFFIQACRGEGRDHGVTLHTGQDENGTSKIPKEADILCHYSTPPGYVAYRDTENGSWFIEQLCEVLGQYWDKMELLHILTLVNHKVSMEVAPGGRKEMPCIVSSLTKLLRL